MRPRITKQADEELERLLTEGLSIAGSKAGLARALGLTRPTVQYWLNGKTRPYSYHRDLLVAYVARAKEILASGPVQ